MDGRKERRKGGRKEEKYQLLKDHSYVELCYLAD